MDQEKYKKKCEKNAENIRQRWNKKDTNDAKDVGKEKEKEKEKEKVKENVKTTT